VPELPEVEVVRAGLEPAVTGSTVASVTVYDERSLRRHAGPGEDFVDRLEGRSILSAERRGKFLWLPLGPSPVPEPVDGGDVQSEAGASTGSATEAGASTGSATEPGASTGSATEALVVHLGMSGQVLLRDRQADDRLTRIRLDIDHPAHGPLRLNFVDQRIFGSMAIDTLLETPDAAGGLVPSQVAHIARDPLDPLFDDRRFLDRLAARNTGVKRALLDQTLLSGVGNIYADEALWASRIHYDQPSSTLSRTRARRLLAEVRLVLAKALGEGGTSFDAQYVNVNGASGYFSHSLNAYGQQGRPCPRCGRSITRVSFMNRGSHFCSYCQRVR
jgi:formamidopyrimidine-DNA glycosylase